MNRTGRQSALRGEPLRALMELAPGRGVKAVLALLLSAAFLLFVRSAFSETGLTGPNFVREEMLITSGQ